MFEGPATRVGEDGVDIRRGAEELALGPGLISSPESMILSSGIILSRFGLGADENRHQNEFFLER